VDQLCSSRRESERDVDGGDRGHQHRNDGNRIQVRRQRSRCFSASIGCGFRGRWLHTVWLRQMWRQLRFHFGLPWSLIKKKQITCCCTNDEHNPKK
jgi:hypothetical protein